MITPLERAADGSTGRFRRGGHRGFRSGSVV
jgi:hypothetical protein